MNQAQAAIELLKRMVSKRGDLMADGSRYQILIPGNGYEIIPSEEAAIGFEYALSQRWLARKEGGTIPFFKITPQGREQLEQLEAEAQNAASHMNADPNKLDASSQQEEIVRLLVRALEPGTPGVTSSTTKTQLIEKAIRSVRQVEDKCKLALEVLSDAEIAGLTRSVLNENRVLSRETKNLAAATFALAVFTFLSIAFSALTTYWAWQDRLETRRLNQREQVLNSREEVIRTREQSAANREKSLRELEAQIKRNATPKKPR